MGSAPRLGAALLAAGSSRRFGDADKLAATFKGRRLGEHAAAAIPVEMFQRCWVITSASGHACEPVWEARGFIPVVNASASQGMGTSVALAARLAQREGLDAVLIVLADMPLVPREHFAALVRKADTPQAILVSADGEARMPPAAFGRDHFADLAQLEADTGARALIARGTIVPCPPMWLADVDTPEALKALD